MATMPSPRSRARRERRLRNGLVSTGCSSFMGGILRLEASIEIGELLARADVVPLAAMVLAGDATLLDEAIRPRKEPEHGAGRDAGEKARMVDGDVGVVEERRPA